jgi:hypothetical protein
MDFLHDSAIKVLDGLVRYFGFQLNMFDNIANLGATENSGDCDFLLNEPYLKIIHSFTPKCAIDVNILFSSSDADRG